MHAPMNDCVPFFCQQQFVQRNGATTFHAKFGKVLRHWGAAIKKKCINWMSAIRCWVADGGCWVLGGMSPISYELSINAIYVCIGISGNIYHVDAYKYRSLKRLQKPNKSIESTELQYRHIKSMIEFMAHSKRKIVNIQFDLKEIIIKMFIYLVENLISFSSRFVEWQRIDY